MANPKKPQSKTRRRWMEGTCPICDHNFKGDKCPHSFYEAEDEVQYQELKDRLVKDIRSELGL